MWWNKRKRKIQELQEVVDQRDVEVEALSAKNDILEKDAVKMKNSIVKAVQEINRLSGEVAGRDKTIQTQGGTIRSLKTKCELMEIRLSLK